MSNRFARYLHHKPFLTSNLVLVFSLWALIHLYPRSCYAYKQSDYRLSIIRAGDRLVNLQSEDGAWAYEVTDSYVYDGHADYNITAQVAMGLLYAFVTVSDMLYLQRAMRSGDLVMERGGETGELLDFGDIIFLMTLGDLSGTPRYKLYARNALNNIIETRYPQPGILLEEAYNTNEHISAAVSEAAYAAALCGNQLYAKGLLQDHNLCLLNLQRQDGAVKGAFLSRRGDGELIYYLRDTAAAINTLYAISKTGYKEAIEAGRELIFLGTDFDISHPGALPAGYIYNTTDDTCEYLPELYTTEDHARQALIFNRLSEKALSDKAAIQLCRTQRSEYGYQGWFQRDDDWASEAELIEYSTVDAYAIGALTARILLNEPPQIYVAGWVESDISSEMGGKLDCFAYVFDPDGDDIKDVWLAAEGSEFHYSIPPYDQHHSFFWLKGSQRELNIQSGGEPGDYLLKIYAQDSFAAVSDPWPYLIVHSMEAMKYDGYTKLMPANLTWQALYERAASPSNGSEPRILAAGYFDTTIHEGIDVTLGILAVITDPNGRADINKVEVLYQGMPTGIMLQDDGQNGDLGIRDSIFGIKIPLRGEDLIGLAGSYLLEIRASDTSGNTSTTWPYINIE